MENLKSSACIRRFSGGTGAGVLFFMEKTGLFPEISCDLFHSFSLFYMERTSGITVAALDTGGGFYLQLLIMICRQRISGFGKIIIFVVQTHIQSFGAGLAVVAVYTGTLR